MARRIRWQIVIASIASALVVLLIGQLALATTAVERPLVGGVYVEAVPDVPQQVIPLLNDPLTDPAGRDVIALLFDGLTRIGLDGFPQAALAERWQVDENNEVYIVQLREDVTWHDGEPFTADDVLFTLRMIQADDFPGDQALANLWRNILADRIDDYTIRFTLSAPYAPFLTALRVPILPEHLLGDIPIDAWADSPFASQPIGTGPYRLTDLTADRALFEANEAYMLRRPFIDTLELRFVETPQAAIPVLNSGDIQAVGASTTTAPELAQIGLPDGTRRITLPLDEYVILAFNLRRSPLDELVMRQTLARGLDKAALVEQVLDGQVARLDTPVLPGWWPYDPTIGWYAYDPQGAAEALEALGYAQDEDGVLVRNERPLQMELITDTEPGRLSAAQEIARQWGEMGIAVEVVEVERMVLRERLQAGDFTLALHGWARLGADPDLFELWHSSQADDGLNYAGLRDEEIDELLVTGRTALNLADRNAAYAAFQRRWVELAPSITLYQPLYAFAVRDQVGGLGFEQADIASGAMLVGREDRYRNVTGWFVRSSREIRSTLR